MVTACQLTQVVRDRGGKLSELAQLVQVLPQVLVNAKIKNEYKTTYRENAVVAAEIQKIEEKFCNRGRVLIRPSGTEPLVRVMLEGDDVAELTSAAEHLAKVMEEQLG